MARTATPDAAAAAAAPKKKSRKGLILAVLAVLVLGAGGAGGWFWWSSQQAAATPGAAKAEPKTPAKPPVFVTLDPFTVNLQEENGEHYLQVQVVYHVADDKVTEQLKVYLPVLRNRILILLAAKRPSELNAPDGKTKLVAELLAAARESVPGMKPEQIQQALLGAFVIQ
jgi:flagellar FliL protein